MMVSCLGYGIDLAVIISSIALVAAFIGWIAALKSGYLPRVKFKMLYSVVAALVSVLVLWLLVVAIVYISGGPCVYFKGPEPY